MTKAGDLRLGVGKEPTREGTDSRQSKGKGNFLACILGPLWFSPVEGQGSIKLQVEMIHLEEEGGEKMREGSLPTALS